MDLPAPLELALGELVLLALGRVALSFLPPGRPGYHEPRELPATLSASHLLGSVLLSALDALAGGALAWSTALALAAAGALLRWRTLPGDLVPRHAVRGERAGPLSRAVALLAFAAALVPWRGRFEAQLPPDLLDHAPVALTRLALLVVVGGGLASARRAPLARSLALLAIAAAWAILARDALEAVWLGAGAAYGIPWLRRADRRAGAIACALLAAPALGSPLGALLAGAALAVLVAATAAPSRAGAARWASLALALALGAGARTGWRGVADLGAPDDARAALGAGGFALAAAALAAAAHALRRARERPAADGRRPAVDPPRRELAALGLALASALFVIAFVGGPRWGEPDCLALAPLVPLAALWVALAGPAERAPAAG